MEEETMSFFVSSFMANGISDFSETIFASVCSISACFSATDNSSEITFLADKDSQISIGAHRKHHARNSNNTTKPANEMQKMLASCEKTPLMIRAGMIAMNNTAMLTSIYSMVLKFIVGNTATLFMPDVSFILLKLLL